MSQTVAGLLVDTLEKIGVKHIFGLIADSLNPIGDAVATPCGQSNIEWIGVRHEEGAALAAAGLRLSKQSSPVGSACVADQPDLEAPISSRAFMRQVTTTRRFLRSLAICRASSRGPTIFSDQQRDGCCLLVEAHAHDRAVKDQSDDRLLLGDKSQPAVP